MHPQLELLLQIQDLKAQRRELQEPEAAGAIEASEFNIDLEGAIASLDERIEELKQELPAPVRSRLESLARGAGRPVAPVINGICYGCFTAVPTASMSSLGRNDRLNACDHCGRYMYVVNP